MACALLAAVAGADFVWDKEKLDSFIAKPDEMRGFPHGLNALDCGSAAASTPEQRTCRSGEADGDCQPGRYEEEPVTEVRCAKRRGAHVNHPREFNPTSWDAAAEAERSTLTPGLNRSIVSHTPVQCTSEIRAYSEERVGRDACNSQRLD